MQVKALACELLARRNRPLARWSVAEVTAETRRSGLLATISDSTVWRWLHADAICPWHHRCWIFPRDRDFARKAGRLLDVYERVWEGRDLQEDEFVLSVDEKTSIQARERRHPTRPPQAGAAMKVEHEYHRGGAWTYLAILDVHRAKLFGRCEPKNWITPFDRLVAQVMTQPPYAQARQAFWTVDNGSAHRAVPAPSRGCVRSTPAWPWCMGRSTRAG